MFIKTK